MTANEIDNSMVRGWELITVRSPDLVLGIVPGLGGSIVSLRRTSDDVELLHRTPWGLPNAATSGLAGAALEVRHDFNPGGWQSLFPNAGDNTVVDGVEWGTDGEARIAPFDAIVEQEAGEDADPDGTRVIMTTRLRRTPFSITKTLTVSGSEIRLSETVRHCGRTPIRVMSGSRLSFAGPLISARTEIDCGAAVVHPDAALLFDVDYDDISPWPRTPGPDSMINLRYLPEPGSETNRMAYLSEFSTGWATISNPEIDCRVRLEWDLEAWPHLWYELEDGGTRDHPWYGAERFLALTPSSGWPAHGVHDARRISDSAVSLDPDDERIAELTLRVENVT